MFSTFSSSSNLLSPFQAKKQQVAAISGGDEFASPEVGEETVVVTRRVNTFAQLQHKQARRIKICLFTTSAILIVLGLILTGMVLAVFFTECFGNCKHLNK